MQEQKTSHLKRCKQCNEWFDGSLKACPNCQTEHNKAYREEIEKRKLNGDLRIPILKVNDDDPLWLVILKKPVQIAQLLLYGIIAFLVYLSTSFAH